jgi:uncharacterized protein DUF4238
VPNITRNNHYVPEATLRRWSIDGERVWGYRLLASHAGVRSWRPELISRLTRQTDLYTEHRSGRDVDSFETFITREFEEPGQRAIEKLVARSRMTPADWHAIARFVVTQDLRTPQSFVEWRRGLQKNIQKSLESSIEKLEDHLRRKRAEVPHTSSGIPSVPESETSDNAFVDVFKISVDRSHATDGLVPVRADIRSARSVWMAHIRHLLTGKADIVCKHHWCSMVPSPGEEWPLTDHPVLCLNYNSPEDYNFGGGWGNPGSEFIMPVSPRLAVYTQVEKRHSGPITLDAPKTRQLQQLFVERAYRWILAREPMDWVEKFRARMVDAARYAAEQEAWNKWHAEQARGEADFDGQSPIEKKTVIEN